MPKQRYEISDSDWELVADLFNTPRRTGRPRADDRLMLNGVFWVLCSGATWRDMPERYGPWSTVYTPSSRGWACEISLACPPDRVKCSGTPRASLII